MEHPTDHIIKGAKNVRLSGEATERIRARLRAHLRENPAQVVPVHSPYQSFFMHSPYLSHLRMPVMALALLLIVGVGGATAFAAASALPGNPLYPVKVSVIEPARVLLATTPEGRAAMTVSIALTRAHEAEQLAVKDELTEEQSAETQEKFNQSLAKAKETLAVLSEKNPDAAASLESSLGISLDAHEAVLDTLSAAKAPGARELAFRVKETRGEEGDTASIREASQPNDQEPIRAAVMMTALAPEPVATTSSTTLEESEYEKDGSSDERERAVEKEKDRILRSLGL